MLQDHFLSRYLGTCGIFLLLLWAADSAFIGAHLIRELTDKMESSYYSLMKERGYPEIFQYVKTCWIMLLFGAVWWRTRQSIYGAWMIVFAYLVSDDAFQIHEDAGSALAAKLGFAGRFGLRPEDFGEMAVSGTFGLLFFVLIVLGYRRSPPHARNACQDIGLLFGLLVFFGVGIDMLHIVVGRYGEVFFGTLEDGGEMYAMSLICAYVYHLVQCGGELPVTVWRQAKEHRLSDLRPAEAKGIDPTSV